MRSSPKISSILAAVLITAIAAGPLHSQGIKGKEILGVRFGALLSTGRFNDIFGGGSEIELHFIEGIGSWYGVTISLSSHNFGRLKDRSEFLRYDKIDLHIYSATVAFLVHKSLGGKFTSTLEGGFGLYTIVDTKTEFIYEGQYTDNQFGVYTGVGLLYKLTRSLSLNLNGKYHYVFSGHGDSHPIYYYTDEDRTQFFQIAVGITILTG